MVQTEDFIRAESPPLVAAVPTDNNSPEPVVSAIQIEPLQLEGVPVVPLEVEEETTNAMEGGQNSMTLSAGVAGGILGLLVGGPVLGVLAGFGAAYAATKDGATGDVARAMGEVANEAKEKAKELDRKHNLVQKGQVATAEAWEKAKELDRKHNILEKTREFLHWSWNTVQEQNRRHNLLERTVNATGVLINFIASKINHTLTSEPSQQQENNHNGNPPPANPSYEGETCPKHQAVVH